MALAYLEDVTLEIPAFHDGVSRLGELWDCHSSKTSGFSLFSTIQEVNCTVRPLNLLEYQMKWILSSEDIADLADLDGMMELELLAGLVKLKHFPDFRKDSVQQLICHYKKETYSVSLSSKTTDMMDRQVMRQLMEGQIKATHVVQEVVLGAELTAEFRFKHSSNIDGSELRKKIANGPVNETTRTELKRLNVSDHPNVGKLTDFLHVLEELELAGSKSAKEQYFPDTGTGVTGVPIRFVLAPISQFLFHFPPKRNKQLGSDLDGFRSMIVAIQDCLKCGFVFDVVTGLEQSLAAHVRDRSFPISMKIEQLEVDIQNHLSILFARTQDAFRRFRSKEASAERLNEMVNEYCALEFSYTNVLTKIEKLVREGVHHFHQSYPSVHLGSNISIFSDSMTLEKWIKNDLDCKILLRTRVGTSDSSIRRLLGASIALRSVGINVGIALPSVCDDESLTISVERHDETYRNADIGSVLSVLRAAVGCGSSLENRFYALISSKFKIPLPLQPMCSVLLLRNMSNFAFVRDVLLANTRQKSLSLINRLDAVWKFYISLDAMDTSLEAVHNLRDLHWKLKSVHCEWIVGSLGVPQMNAAPLLFVFLDEEIRAVCFDSLDLLILVKLFEDCDFGKANEPNFAGTIAPEELASSFYPDRARYAIEALKCVGCWKSDSSIDVDIKPFSSPPNRFLNDALEIVRSAMSTNSFEVMATVVRHVLREHSKLDPVFVVLLDRDDISRSTQEKIPTLYTMLKSWICSKNPFMGKVETAIVQLQRVQKMGTEQSKDSRESCQLALAALMIDPTCPEELNQRLKGLLKLRNDEDIEKSLEILLELTTISRELVPSFYLAILMYLIRCEDHYTIRTSQACDFVLRKYIGIMKLDDTSELEELLKSHLLQDIHSLLAKRLCGQALSFLHRELDKVTSIDLALKEHQVNLANMFRSLCAKGGFSGEQWATLWSRPRFQYLVRIGSEYPTVQEAISSMTKRYISKMKYLPANVKRNI